MADSSKKFPLHTKIFIGMLAGLLGGACIQLMITDTDLIEKIVSYVKPVGDIFLRLIFMMVIPLIISGLSLGIAELGDLRKIGRIGLITLAFTLVLTLVSVFVGIGMAEFFRPGDSLSEADRQILLERFGDKTSNINTVANSLASKNFMEIIAMLIPKNPFEDIVYAFNPAYGGGGLLAVMFFTVMLGVSLSLAPAEKTATFKGFLEGLFEITMKAIQLSMKMAPYGVAALMFSLAARTGLSVFVVLLKYVLAVIGALAIHQFINYGLVLKYMVKTSPILFFSRIREVMITAFSTSSSNATLPTAIRVAQEELKLPKRISNFVLTVGSTTNQNGTALYEGITVLFLAQCFGIQLDFSQQVILVLIAVISGIGTAGVPGGSLPVVMLILTTVGIPGESIAIIFGVDRLLDMCRTTLNVTGDLVAAAYVSKLETGKETD